jgi:hypothetical protein
MEKDLATFNEVVGKCPINMVRLFGRGYLKPQLVNQAPLDGQSRVGFEVRSEVKTTRRSIE